jgi:plastocyanin
MLRKWVVGLLGMMVTWCAPAAWACDCGSGGVCHCGATCACGTGSSGTGTSAGGTATMDSMSMTSPTDQIVAIAAEAPQTVHVDVNSFSFGADVTIHVGDTVQWDWKAPIFHTITTVNGSAESFDSGLMSSGSYSHTFTQAEKIVYYCEVHGFDNFDGTATGMAATVTVLPVPEPTGIALLAVGAVATIGTRRRPRA